MKRSGWLAASIAILLLIGPVTPVLAAKSNANHFATVFVDGKKVGHVHFAVRSSEADEVEELKTRAAMSVLGDIEDQKVIADLRAAASRE